MRPFSPVGYRRVFFIAREAIPSLSIELGQIVSINPASPTPVIAYWSGDDAPSPEVVLPDDYSLLIPYLDSGALDPFNFGVSCARWLLSQPPERWRVPHAPGRPSRSLPR